jgi:hypothetical protein
MLMTEPIESKNVVFQGKTITIKEYCRLLKRQENLIPISRDAIEFCRHQIDPDNSWGIWYSIISSWKEMGLSNREIFQVILQSQKWGPQYSIYGGAKRELCMKMLNDVDLADEYCQDAIEAPEAYGVSPYYSPSEGLIILANHNQLLENYYPLISKHLPAHDLRIILKKIPANTQRDILARIFSKENLQNNQGTHIPKVVLHYTLPVIDLLPSEIVDFVSSMAEELSRTKGNNEEEIATSDRLIHHAKTKTPLQDEPDASGMTTSAASVVDYLEEEHIKRQRLAGFSAYVESLKDRHISVNAPELRSIFDWKKSSSDRKNAIIKEIETTMEGIKFTGFAENELSIAQFKHKSSKQVLSLIPGGEVEMGLSDAEEKLLREYLESGDKKLSEEDSEILNAIDQMRPVKKIHIEPMLAAQKISVKGDIPALLDWIEAQPFRLPSEAEWEYLARGTKQQELTWNGHVIPDKNWMKEIKKHLNEFHLGEFGLFAEICSDVWKPTHTAIDHQAVTGEGPRVCRGGAADLAPWQNCGEWHLLCTAFRYSAESLLLIAGRAVIGIKITK